jgi:hypothetical protein
MTPEDPLWRWHAKARLKQKTTTETNLKRKSAWSMCSDERALNRMPEQCTITGGLMSGLAKNGDKCSHSEPESSRLYYSSFRYTAALRRKRISQFRANALL